MQRIQTHFVHSLIAGIVALLPIAGLAVTVVYFENQVAASWLKEQGFYFFGLGLLLVAVLLYLVGLTVSTFIGRWLWRKFDSFLAQVPVLGNLYQTMKQIFGYDEGPKGLFRRVVFVPGTLAEQTEIGLVTQEPSEQTDGRLVVFIPTAPSPTNGRLVFIEPEKVLPSSMTASQAMQFIVSLGSLPPK